MKRIRWSALLALLFLPWQLVAADGAAWRVYGAKLMSAQRPSEALKAYGQALKVDRKDAIAWAGAGNAQWALGQKRAALTSWKASLSLQPQNQPLADFVAKIEGSPKPAKQAVLAAAPAKGWMDSGMKSVFLGLGLAVVALF